MANSTLYDTSIRWLITLSLYLAFFDECIRRILPEQPIIITLPKEIIYGLAGLLIIIAELPRLTVFFAFSLGWLLYGICSSLMSGYLYESLSGTAVSLRSYAWCLTFFASGFYIGLNRTFRSHLAKQFVLLAFLALFAAFAQEFARDSLPTVLSARIYIEGHYHAGGNYNESFFASPQTLSHVLLFTIIIEIHHVATSSEKRIDRIAFVSLRIIPLVVGVAITRIRTAVFLLPFAFVSMTALYMLGNSGPKRSAYIPRMATLIAAFAIVAAACFMVIPGNDTFESESLDRDISFYMYLINPEELLWRSGVFFGEMESMPNHNPVLGYGAGTGSLQAYFPRLPEDVPLVLDTGIFHLYHEFGMIGMTLFMTFYCGMGIRSVLAYIRDPKIEVDLIPLTVTSFILLIWYLFKSFTCIRNGMSHMIWLTCLGASHGLIEYSASLRSVSNKSIVRDNECNR